jgi:hypothetical protein
MIRSGPFRRWIGEPQWKTSATATVALNLLLFFGLPRLVIVPVPNHPWRSGLAILFALAPGFWWLRLQLQRDQKWVDRGVAVLAGVAALFWLLSALDLLGRLVTPWIRIPF